MWALARPDGGGACRNLRATEPRALREHPPGFLLDRDAAETGLQSEALGNLVVEITYDDRCHVAIIV